LVLEHGLLDRIIDDAGVNSELDLGRHNIPRSEDQQGLDRRGVERPIVVLEQYRNQKVVNGLEAPIGHLRHDQPTALSDKRNEALGEPGIVRDELDGERPGGRSPRLVDCGADKRVSGVERLSFAQVMGGANQEPPTVSVSIG
jgi:hypothetical protein